MTPDCRRCAHGTDEDDSFVYCTATWAVVVCVTQGHARRDDDTRRAGLSLQQPFGCVHFKRDNGQSCGCDRGALHKCERHR